MRLSKVTVIMMALGLMLIYGCGSSDVLDETGQRYTATIAIQDLDEETLTVDAFRSSCDGEPEPYGPVSAAVTFTVNDTAAAGITLTNYVIEYIPLPSEDGVSGLVMPPALDGPLVGGNLGIDILPGESASFDIECMSTDTKEEYRFKLGWIICAEDPSGTCQLEIAAIQTQIDDTETAIDATIAAINAPPADEAALDFLLALLDTQNEQLNTLWVDYWDQYYEYLEPTPELDESRYKIRITFHFEDATGNDRTISREATVWLGNYNKC